MSKHKIRVLVSKTSDKSNVYRWVQANSINELNDRIVKTYIECGRIWEFIDKTNIVPSNHNITFAEYADDWMKLYKENKVKPSTIATYRKYLQAHILPSLGSHSIGSITTEDIQRFLNERDFLSAKTLRCMKNMLNEVFRDAEEDGLIKKAPTESKRISIPSKIRYERTALSISQFKDILANADLLKKKDQQLLLLLMLTGMRRGEVLGLRWEDIDVEKQIIHIQRNVTHANGNQPIIGTPKSKSGVRIIPLDPFLLDRLAPIQGKGFILGNTSPYTMTQYNNAWKRINAKIDLYGATAHVFRHSYLTYLAGEGTDLKTLQSIAGHSTVTLTLNQYVHTQTEKITEAGDSIHRLLIE